MDTIRTATSTSIQINMHTEKRPCFIFEFKAKFDISEYAEKNGYKRGEVQRVVDTVYEKIAEKQHKMSTIWTMAVINLILVVGIPIAVLLFC